MKKSKTSFKYWPKRKNRDRLLLIKNLLGFKINPRLGPLKIPDEDWINLVNNAKQKVFQDSKGVNHVLIFVVTEYFKRGRRENRIEIVPYDYFGTLYHKTDLIKKIPNVIAFGYVRADTLSVKDEIHDTVNVCDIIESLDKPIYYIIMNKKFEYEIYCYRQSIITPHPWFGYLWPVAGKGFPPDAISIVQAIRWDKYYSSHFNANEKRRPELEWMR